MNFINGDITAGVINIDKPTVILHGCNCLHTMGKGLALYLRKKFPQIIQADKRTGYADRNKLGTYSKAIIHPNLHILNCYTQFHYRQGPHSFQENIHADYNAIRACLRKVNEEYDGWEIRCPKIGCGLARGAWDIVHRIIEEELGAQIVTLYYL